jgi:hypothetical protein
MSSAESTFPQGRTKSGEPVDAYLAWLRSSGAPVFEAAGACWRPYHRCLVPADLNPKPIPLSEAEARGALQESGCMFIRYFTQRFDHPTEFWYIACAQYDFGKLSANTRSKVRRGQKRHEIRRLSGEWLAEHGYSCFLAAHRRYKGAPVDSREVFEAKERKCIGGPFDWWGVFSSEILVGYARCVVGKDYVATLVLKFDPEHLKSYSAYALMDAILSKYVRDEHKLATNGFRSLAHDTNMQQFLQQFAFQNFYCDLKIVYRPFVGLGISLLYPFLAGIDRIGKTWPLSLVQSVLTQERIRRSFMTGAALSEESGVRRGAAPREAG